MMTLLQSLNKPYCTLAGISEMLRRRHLQTQMHSERVVMLADVFARACALTHSQRTQLLYSALLHDVGKISIPDSILMFPGPLDDPQREVMQQHSATGEAIIRLMQLEDGEEIAGHVRHHHEHYDGSGYPDGLAGKAIPLLARMLTILDSYDALRETRPYRPALSHTQAIEIMHRERGIKHDPELLERFFEIPEIKTIEDDAPDRLPEY
jgi:HD-GYP domain-containing protein (c-di-GMP phosphodiesterase class II)